MSTSRALAVTGDGTTAASATFAVPDGGAVPARFAVPDGVASGAQQRLLDDVVSARTVTVGQPHTVALTELPRARRGALA